jgi:hypothetical protein
MSNWKPHVGVGNERTLTTIQYAKQQTVYILDAADLNLWFSKCGWHMLRVRQDWSGGMRDYPCRPITG